MLQGAYKEELWQHFGIVFNSLFCLNNMPIKRYVDYLQRRNKLEEYMKVHLTRWLLSPFGHQRALLGFINEDCPAFLVR